MSPTIKGALQGDGKNVSSSRLVMLSVLLMIFVLWVLVGILITATDAHDWDRYSGWMSWGRDYALIAVVPYIGGKIAGAVEAKTGG